MQSFTAGQANIVGADMVNRSTGAPIESGTINFYLVAKDGDNAGKWFRASDDSWQAAESSAGEGTHESDGHWTCNIDTAAWTAGLHYRLYAKESGDLHIPYSDEVLEIQGPIEVTVEAST